MIIGRNSQYRGRAGPPLRSLKGGGSLSVRRGFSLIHLVGTQPRGAAMISVTHPFRKGREKDGAPSPLGSRQVLFGGLRHPLGFRKGGEDWFRCAVASRWIPNLRSAGFRAFIRTGRAWLSVWCREPQRLRPRLSCVLAAPFDCAQAGS